MELTGIIPPLITPLSDNRVSSEFLCENIDRLNNLDLGGHLVLGSTGEAALMTEQERASIWKAARGCIPSDKVMIAGTGMESTDATVRMTGIAADCGADFALVITPCFFKKQMGQEA